MLRRVVSQGIRGHVKTASVRTVSPVAAVFASEGESQRGRRLLDLLMISGATLGIIAASSQEASCDASAPIAIKTSQAEREAKTNSAWVREQEGYVRYGGLKLFTGNSNRPLATDIANHLGMSLGKVKVGHFADGEVNVVINENVRGKDVYIVQPTSPPVNETLMELLHSVFVISIIICQNVVSVDHVVSVDNMSSHQTFFELCGIFNTNTRLCRQLYDLVQPIQWNSIRSSITWSKIADGRI